MRLILNFRIRIISSSIWIAGVLALSVGGFAGAETPDSYSLEHLNFLKTERALTEKEHASSVSKQKNAKVEVDSVDNRLRRTIDSQNRLKRRIMKKDTDLLDLAVRISETQNVRSVIKRGIEDLLTARVIAERNEPVPLLASSAEMNTAIRKTLLVSDVVPSLASRLGSLRAVEAELKKQTEEFQSQRRALKKDEDKLRKRESEVKILLKRRQANYSSAVEEAQALASRLGQLTADIQTLEQLLIALEKSIPINPIIKPGLRQRESTITAMYHANTLLRPELKLKPLGDAEEKRLVLPVIGKITDRFNSATSADAISEGLGIETEQQQPVVSPADGKITFAGDFGIYGQTVILQTIDGYHIVLYGFGKIFGAVSQKVLTGELIGQTSNRTDPPPKLVIELRKDEELLDPENWME